MWLLKNETLCDILNKRTNVNAFFVFVCVQVLNQSFSVSLSNNSLLV